MSKKNFQAIRGMRDLYDGDARDFEYLLTVVRDKLHTYGYQPFHPPILESTDLFARAVGEGTDVVEKEMFTFDDHGDILTLRPEATAGIVRAVVQHGMTFGTHKLWTAGPMFRRERPQKGRYRQFHQFSVETFGVAEPEAEAEQLLMTAECWKALGIAEHVELKINTLATPEVRETYRMALVDYLTAHHDQLDEDSQRRLGKNPLRILDSKNPAMAALIADAPKLNDYLDEVSSTHFNRVLACLNAAEIAYTIDPTLVRGLDYYSHTVYEWVTDRLGAQGTICGGGRYDGLAEHIGGKPTPGVGFGLGIDRTVLLMQALDTIPAPKPPLAYFVVMGDAAKRQALLLAQRLRQQADGRAILVHLQNSGMKAQFKKADQSHADYAVIIGEDELTQGVATVKQLSTGNQQAVTFDELPIHLLEK